METTKTILWVEDFDTKDTSTPVDDLDDEVDCVSATVHINEIQNVFPEEHCSRVDLQETVDGALKAIDTYWENYDCVVLDVNLGKGWPPDHPMQESIKKQLSDAGVNFPDEIRYFKENTGYFLYLYLLCKGFPKDRVIMRTAYNGTGVDNLTNKWNTAFNNAGLIPPTNVGKSDNDDKFHSELEKLYPSEDNYYLIRRLILDAANHWIKVISGEACDVNSFVFNAAVADDKRLDTVDLHILLDEIRAFYPVRHNKKVGSGFSNVLRKLSVPFEAYADYSKVSGNRNAFTYLSIMRLIRNWYAHNIISTDEPTEKEFLFLVIIAFRALFDDKSYHNDTFDYEDDILKYLGTKVPSKPDKVIAEELVYGFFRDTYGKIVGLKTLDSKYKIFSTEYWRLLDALGQDKSDHSGCSYKKLIELIWTSKYPIALKFNNKSPTIKQTDGFPDSTMVYLNYPIIGDCGSDILDCILCVDYSLWQ